MENIKKENFKKFEADGIIPVTYLPENELTGKKPIRILYVDDEWDAMYTGCKAYIINPTPIKSTNYPNTYLYQCLVYFGGHFEEFVLYVGRDSYEVIEEEK